MIKYLISRYRQMELRFRVAAWACAWATIGMLSGLVWLAIITYRGTDSPFATASVIAICLAAALMIVSMVLPGDQPKDE